MTTLPFSVQLRKAETIEQFNKRVQKARADFIQQQRPAKQAKQQARSGQATRRNPGHEPRYVDSLVTAARAQWLAGLRIDDIALNWGVQPNTVRALCHDWDRRADCIPSLQDVQLYRSVGFKRKLPDGPKLDARLTRWIAAVEAQARRNRPEHNRRRG